MPSSPKNDVQSTADGDRRLVETGPHRFDIRIIRNVGGTHYCDLLLSQQLLPAILQWRVRISARQWPSVVRTGHASFRTLIFHTVV